MLHGSAFDITSKGRATPIGTFWCAVMMLGHLNETSAVERVTGNPGLHTPDLGGKVTMADVTTGVLEAFKE